MNATGSVLVDTNIVVDYFRHDLSLHEKVDLVGDVYLALPVLGELLYGAYRFRHKDTGAGAGILKRLHRCPA